MQTSISLEDTDIKYLDEVGPDRSKAVRGIISFHRDNAPLLLPVLETMGSAKRFLDEGSLNQGDYRTICDRVQKEFFKKLNEKAGK